MSGILIAALIYHAWTLTGIRFVTHDDIFLHLNSYVFRDNFFPFADWVGRGQGRVQAYLNMPLILWVDGQQDSIAYDVLNVGSICLVYVLFAILLGRIGCWLDSACLTAFALFSFPLHYYFTFPQGFPVMACWPLAALIASGICLDICLGEDSPRLLGVGLLLFALSFFGPEYHIVLNPAVLLVVGLCSKSELRRKLRIGLPFLVCAVLTAIVIMGPLWYFNRHLLPGTDDGRTAVTFAPLAFLRTFWLLQAKAFLPVGLLGGIQLATTGVHGLQRIPSVLDFTGLLHQIYDRSSTILVFVAASILFTAALFTSSARRIVPVAMMCSVIVVIPSAVLAVSGLYQQIVVAGYLQGHLVAFYTNLGACGLIFVAIRAVLTASGARWHFVLVPLGGMVLALSVVTSFTYNIVNRQVMSANSQKWPAFDLLANYLSGVRPDLAARAIALPDFWLSAGVSTIPTLSPFTRQNYWASYAEYVRGIPLNVLDRDAAVPVGTLTAGFSALPAGDPIVILSDPTDQRQRVVLLRVRPANGELASNGEVVADITSDDWRCVTICEASAPMPPHASLAGVTFEPQLRGPRGQLAMFALPRYGAFGRPFLR